MSGSRSIYTKWSGYQHEFSDGSGNEELLSRVIAFLILQHLSWLTPIWQGEEGGVDQHILY